MYDISIIVPVYNVEKYLQRCMESLIEQKDVHLEILLIDDGSVDASGIICDEFADTYADVKVIHKENEGLGLTRNRGIREATGEYILFVDSDDFLQKNILYSLYDYVKMKNSDVCFFMRNLVDRKGNVTVSREKFPEQTVENKRLISLCFGEPLKKDLYTVGAAWKAIYRREFLQQHKLYFLSERDYLSEDYIFSAELCSYNPKVSFYEEPIYFYCDNEGSLTNSYRRDRWEKAVKLFDKLNETALKHCLGEEAYNRNYNNFLINLLVSFKHICLCRTMRYEEKKHEIKLICDNDNIQKVLCSRDYADGIALKVLRQAVICKRVRFISFIIKIRYCSFIRRKAEE